MLSQSSHSINVAVSVNDCHRSVTVSEILRCKILVGAAVMTNENLECTCLCARTQASCVTNPTRNRPSYYQWHIHRILIDNSFNHLNRPQYEQNLRMREYRET